MIQLDANYLILGAISGTPQNADLERWLSRGEALSTSAIAWMEFITGPVAPELAESMRKVVEDRILSIGAEEAELAAELFNACGRKRAQRYDCLIAASAIRSKAQLATANPSDFAFFSAHGLSLAA